jgi:membrane-associated phospholipid phosphatase
MLAVIIIVPISAVLPAAGAAYYYGVGMPNYLPDLLALRDGSLIDIDIAANKGLIQFPSYHTAAAMLAINAFRTSRLLFLPNLVLSGLLILAVPVFGNHYAVDAVAGAAVAAFAIWAARRLAWRLSAEPAPATAYADPERSTPSPARAA